MIKKWKEIKVGDKFKDGSTVTQIHLVHKEPCCKVIYDTDKEFDCAYRHVLLIDVSNVPDAGKKELNEICTFVPLEENYEIFCDETLSDIEGLIVEQFCHNEPINVQVDKIEDGEVEVYDFHFDTVKRISIKNTIIKSEPQKVDENTYWLTCKGIEYLMNKYQCTLYCNGLIINQIIPIGDQECFCISTDTGRYET